MPYVLIVLQTADEKQAFKYNKEVHLQPILSQLEAGLNKVKSFIFLKQDLSWEEER